MSKPHIARMAGWWYCGTKHYVAMATRAASPRRAFELFHFFRDRTKAGS